MFVLFVLLYLKTDFTPVGVHCTCVPVLFRHPFVLIMGYMQKLVHSTWMCTVHTQTFFQAEHRTFTSSFSFKSKESKYESKEDKTKMTENMSLSKYLHTALQC